MEGDAQETFAVQPWQNLVNANDVNDDSHVTPLDMLLVIFAINSQGAGPISATRGVPPFVDVNGDGGVTAEDVLWLINFIDGLSWRVGEGEADENQTPSSVGIDPAWANLASRSSPVTAALALTGIPATLQVHATIGPVPGGHAMQTAGVPTRTTSRPKDNSLAPLFRGTGTISKCRSDSAAGHKDIIWAEFGAEDLAFAVSSLHADELA